MLRLGVTKDCRLHADKLYNLSYPHKNSSKTCKTTEITAVGSAAVGAYLVVVLLEVLLGDEVPVEVEVEHEVLAVQVPGHGEVVHVSPLSGRVARVRDLALVARVVQPGRDLAVCLQT